MTLSEGGGRARQSWRESATRSSACVSVVTAAYAGDSTYRAGSQRYDEVLPRWWHHQAEAPEWFWVPSQAVSKSLNLGATSFGSFRLIHADRRYESDTRVRNLLWSAVSGTLLRLLMRVEALSIGEKLSRSVESGAKLELNRVHKTLCHLYF